MKKIMCLLLAILCVGCLLGCSASEQKSVEKTYNEAPKISAVEAKTLIRSAVIDKLENSFSNFFDEHELSAFLISSFDDSAYGEYAITGMYVISTNWNDTVKTYGFSGTVDKHTGEVTLETIFGNV